MEEKCNCSNVVSGGLKSDSWIEHMARHGEMIRPFTKSSIRLTGEHPVISYGVSSYGYDIRLAQEFSIFSNIGVIDPKHFEKSLVVEKTLSRNREGDDYILLPPNCFMLARSVEYFKIPRNVLAICLGKSTYARCGIITPITALEPEWEGHITLEIANVTNMPAKIYPGEGITQVIFFVGAEECETSYADRNGKYQAQTGITLPKV